jgi:trimethylamine--corrinoid protein Co-methyltransferase
MTPESDVPRPPPAGRAARPGSRRPRSTHAGPAREAPPARLRVLAGEDCARVRAAAFRLLAEVGVQTDDEEARESLKRAGARQDAEGRLRLGEETVLRTLERVPRRLVLFDQDGRQAVDTADRHPRFGLGINCLRTLDWRTGQLRSCTLADIRETARLCERLPNVDLAASLGNPNELPAAEQALAAVKALAEGTRKPLAYAAHDEREGEAIWGWLAERAGGWQALSDRPFALDLTGPRSPLRLGAEACRRLAFAARRRLPVVCYPALLPGTNGPATLEGALAQSTAEILAGLALHQLAGPGSPVVTGSSILPMDLRSGAIAYGSPDYVLACLAAVDLFGELGIPTWTGAGCSDAHTVDAQAAAEAGMNLHLAALSGTSFIHNLGYLSGGKTGSLEMLVLCDELAGSARRLAAGLEVSEGRLAVPVSARATPDNSFLTDEHTLEHMRTAVWSSALFRRANLEDWQREGSLSLQDRLRARLRELLG